MTNQDKIIREIKKKLGIIATASNTCSYPYWNNKGPFIDLNEYMEDAPYQGYNPGGPEQITGFCKKYLGRILYRICSITRKLNGNVYKDGNNFFIIIEE